MEKYLIERSFIPETKIEGQRLGRHLNHDSRSRDFRVDQVTPKSVAWSRHTPPLDQGNLGSCTGNATVGVLGTDPFYSTLSAAQQKALDEGLAIKIYSLATAIDTYAGEYPPNDTGSDGLSAAKAAQEVELISGYQHAFSIEDFMSGMQKGPAISGINWLTGCDSPNSEGIVRYTGTLRGGHEIEASELDLERGLVWFWQSWGLWGRGGRFAMSLDDYALALSHDGDATFFTPLSQPAPTPTPVPTPPSATDRPLIAAMDPWSATITSTFTKAGKAKAAYQAWKQKKGY